MNGLQDVLSKEIIEQRLAECGIMLSVQTEQKVDSTNNVLKAYAEEGLKQDLVLIAEEQSAGRGRRGRSFFSPEGTGLYMSLLLHPQGSVEECAMLTTLAGAAAAGAIEQVSGQKAGIKWVNDVFVRGKKIAGILTEVSPAFREGRPEYAIVGIGVNLYEPANGFPEELRETVGAIFTEKTAGAELRSQLAAEFLIRFMKYYRGFPEKRYLEMYRSHLLAVGEKVRITEPEGAKQRAEDRRKAGREYAKVLGVDEVCRLEVQYEDGTVEFLSGGEISIRF